MGFLLKETTSWTNSSGEFPEKLLLLKKCPLNSSPRPTKNSTCMIETLRCMHLGRKGLVFPHSFPLSQSSQMTALMQLHLHLRKDSCCPRGPTMTEMLSRQLVCLLQAQSSCCLLRLRHRSSNTLDPPLKHTSLLPQSGLFGRLPFCPSLWEREIVWKSARARKERENGINLGLYFSQY